MKKSIFQRTFYLTTKKRQKVVSLAGVYPTGVVHHKRFILMPEKCSKVEQALKELSEIQRFYSQIPKINQRSKSSSKKRLARKKSVRQG